MASLKNVKYTYPGTDKQILKNVSVKLSQSSRVALIGANGAGKTTLLKLLVGGVCECVYARACTRAREGERERGCVCVCVCVCRRERERESVCVCVCACVWR